PDAVAAERRSQKLDDAPEQRIGPLISQHSSGADSAEHACGRSVVFVEPPQPDGWIEWHRNAAGEQCREKCLDEKPPGWEHEPYAFARSQAKSLQGTCKRARPFSHFSPGDSFFVLLHVDKHQLTVRSGGTAKHVDECFVAWGG